MDCDNRTKDGTCNIEGCPIDEAELKCCIGCERAEYCTHRCPHSLPDTGEEE